MSKKTYKEMYEEAAASTRDKEGTCRYKGYKKGNALSLYVYDKYNVNAADDYSAHRALIDALNA